MRLPYLRCFALAGLAATAGVAASFAEPFALQRTYVSEAPLDQFGFAVQAAGDVDADGFADFLVGANVNDSRAAGGGAVYLYRGGSNYPSTAAISYGGPVAGANCGAAVCGGADLDGDGYDDWAVGAPGLGTTGNDAGRVYVFRGGAIPDAEPDLVIQGSVPGGQFGAAVLLVPDLDGDGYGDLVVGAPRAGNGELRIYRGGPALDATADRVIHARAQDSRFARSLAWLPDDNGDGRNELLVGAPHSSQAGTWAGAVVLYRGTAALDSIPDLVLFGQAAGDEFGTSLAAGADLDGDGAGDVVVGAPSANVNGVADAGKAYVFRGGAAIDAVPDWLLRGNAAGDHFGLSVAAGFDWDADSKMDFAIGAPDADANGTDRGVCTIYRGGATLDITPDATVTGNANSAHLGMSLASAGDVRHNTRGALIAGGFGPTDGGQALLLASNDVPSSAFEGPVARTALLQPGWPNPTRGGVRSALHVPSGGQWTVDVFDARGRHVARVLSAWLPAGVQGFEWNGRDDRGTRVAGGVYCVRAHGDTGAASTRVTLLR